MNTYRMAYCTCLLVTFRDNSLQNPWDRPKPQTEITGKDVASSPMNRAEKGTTTKINEVTMK